MLSEVDGECPTHSWMMKDTNQHIHVILTGGCESFLLRVKEELLKRLHVSDENEEKDLRSETRPCFFVQLNLTELPQLLES